MKCNIPYSSIISEQNLRIAYINARRGKRKYRDVQIFEKDIDGNIKKLHELLSRHEYRTSAYRTQYVTDSNKTRKIYKLPFYPDRIVQWAIILQMDSFFRSQFSEHSHASIKGKGIHTALRDVQNAFKEGYKYCYKIDVRKFFPHVDHTILKQMLEHQISDRDTLSLLFENIESVPKDEGLPIGNYCSQYYANYYLTPFDDYLTKKGIRFVRYMDDICIFLFDKIGFRPLQRDIEWFLLRKLNLTLKDNWQLFPIDIRGLDFVGYRIWKDKTIIRKSIFKRIRKRTKSINEMIKLGMGVTEHDECSVMSYYGWIKFCSPRARTTILKFYFNDILKFIRQ